MTHLLFDTIKQCTICDRNYTTSSYIVSDIASADMITGKNTRKSVSCCHHCRNLIKTGWKGSQYCLVQDALQNCLQALPAEPPGSPGRKQPLFGVNVSHLCQQYSCYNEAFPRICGTLLIWKFSITILMPDIYSFAWYI